MVRPDIKDNNPEKWKKNVQDPMQRHKDSKEQLQSPVQIKTPSPTPSISVPKTGHKGSLFSQVPIWIIAVSGLIAALAIIFCIYCCCCRKCGKKSKKDKDKKNGKERVDLQAVKIGASYQEKVQPSMDELDYNSEDYYSDVSSGVKIGRINFTLDYSFNDNTLTVGIVRAEDIPAKDFSGSSDPYVKIYLLPDKKKKFETKVHRRTLNPVFNETFVIKNIPYSEITNRILLLELFDFDRFSRHDLIGEARLPLIDVDLASSINEWRVLTPPHSSRSASGGSRSELGEICFSLRYVPTAGKLQITIVEAKGLKSMDLSGYSDPYVKIALVQEGRKIKKKKTTVKKRTLDPYFNETFTFQVAFEKIEQTSLIITVLDYDRVGKSEMIGKCVVGELSSGADLRHWADMLGSPRRAITQWHTLHN